MKLTHLRNILLGGWIMALISVNTGAAQKSDNSPMVTVDRVDLQRYTGRWYEIARMPNRFQNKCAGNVTAVYRLRDDGQVEVVNSCRTKTGSTAQAKGLAKVVDPTTCAKLKVSFFRPLGISLFWGDYWIIGLDPDYRWAVVGHPQRKYGWILARDPQLKPEELTKIYTLLREKGYRPEEFIPTEQNWSNR
jgi:apolipoprotein D and lipocalin family protein